MFYCHNCGTPVPENARFCHVCGAEQFLEEAAEAPPLEWSKAHPEEAARFSQPAPRESQRSSWEARRPEPVTPPEPVREEPPVQPAPAPAAPAAPPPVPPRPEAPQVQIPFPSGSYTWENVKISGEFKNGVGSITITFN